MGNHFDVLIGKLQQHSIPIPKNVADVSATVAALRKAAPGIVGSDRWLWRTITDGITTRYVLGGMDTEAERAIGTYYVQRKPGGHKGRRYHVLRYRHVNVNRVAYLWRERGTGASARFPDRWYVNLWSDGNCFGARWVSSFRCAVRMARAHFIGCE